MNSKAGNNFETLFLQELCRIKKWKYHSRIEKEKSVEVRQFISHYISQESPTGFAHSRLRYNRLNLLINHPDYQSSFRALLLLFEKCEDEFDFIDKYQKVTSPMIGGKVRIEAI